MNKLVWYALFCAMGWTLSAGGAVAQRADAASATASASAAAPASAPQATAAQRSTFRIQPVDDAWRAALPRDAAAATQAYLDRLSADVVARSNAYYEGGYWLTLWNWLAGVAVALLLLATRPSTALRDWAARRIRWAPVRDALYGAAYAAASWLLTLPLTVYQSFIREHQYGMATQTFGAWFGEQLTALAVSVVIGAVLVALLYAVLRRARANWWLWGTAVTMVFMAVSVAIAPIWIQPLFNTYRPVPDGPVKTAVLQMARASGVPVDNVYVFDASRQTTRVSAYVSGLFGTAAVRLNDNLLERSSEPEIRAVMAHEIGHYVLNHIPKTLLMLGVLIAVGVALSQWVMRLLMARFGARWRLLSGGGHARANVDANAGIGDVATLPLLVAVLSTWLFLMTPLLNTITRTQEIEADAFGVNLAREPLGMAEVLLKLTEYRKPDPGAIEEFVFFTHPGARTRIGNAMRWREQMLPARP